MHSYACDHRTSGNAYFKFRKEIEKRFVFQFIHEDFLRNFPLFSRFTLKTHPSSSFLTSQFSDNEGDMLCFGTKWRTNDMLFPGVGITRVCLRKSGPRLQKLCGVGGKRRADKGKKG